MSDAELDKIFTVIIAAGFVISFGLVWWSTRP